MANGLLGTSFDDPRTRFNLATAMGLLEAGGPSPVRTSIGQGIGRAGMMGMQAYDAALQAQRAKKLEDLQFKSAQAELAKMQAEADQKRRMATALGRYKMAATPEMRAQIYATEIDPLGVAKFQMEQRAKAPDTIEVVDPVTRQTKRMGYNVQTGQYDKPMGLSKLAPDPKTITAGGQTGTIGQDVFGRSTFIPLPGAPVTPQKPTFVQTGVEGQPGATQQNILVPDSTAPGGYRLVPAGPEKLPRLATGMQITTSPTGETTITTGVTADGIEKGVKKDLQTLVGEIDGTIASLRQTRADYKPEFLTVPGRWSNIQTNISEKLGFTPSRQDTLDAMEYNAFMASAGKTFSEQLLRLSGAAVSQGEYERAKTWIPFVGTANNPFAGDSPTQFEIKARNMEGTLVAAKYRALKVLKGNEITSDLARKYPISMKKNDVNLYIHEYVDMLVKQGVTEEAALEMWTKEAQSS
jgi:hypothetical protein